MHSKDIHNHLQQRLAGMEIKECNHKPQGLPVFQWLIGVISAAIVACALGW